MKVIEGAVSEIIPENTVHRIVEERIGVIVIGKMVTAEIGTGLERDHFPGNYGDNRTRSMSNSRSRSGSRVSTNRDRIRCYNCREYDHFAWDCPTSGEERDIDRLQQMLNLEGEQTHLLTNTQNNPVENPRASPLNLLVVGMVPPHSYHSAPKRWNDKYMCTNHIWQPLKTLSLYA